MVDKYWLEWANNFIQDVDGETPENFADDYKEKIAIFFKKMVEEAENRGRMIGEQLDNLSRKMNSLANNDFMTMRQRITLLRMSSNINKIKCGEI